MATDFASKMIRYGLKTRDEMIPFVEEHDGILDKEGNIPKEGKNLCFHAFECE